MNTYMHASICTGEQRHRALRGCAAAGGVKGVRQASAAMERVWYAFRLLLCCFACGHCKECLPWHHAHGQQINKPSTVLLVGFYCTSSLKYL